ncbi:MAG: hypothetical protein ACNA77_09265 [Opitutales bacterium]
MLAPDASKRIGFVVNAKGGTKIEQWAKGTRLPACRNSARRPQ